MSAIIVELNPDRTLGGELRIVKSDGTQEGYGLSVLGKAAYNDAGLHGNPSANQLVLYGDTPTGTYSVLEITNGPYRGNAHSYGPNGVIKMAPTSGNAATAAANGRTGLLIHGGDLGAGGLLRRTNGCLRLSNEEFLYLKNTVLSISISDPADVVKVLDTGNVSNQSFNNDTCGDGDPPFGL